ncbi:MAG: Flp pilus assembly complex ATPase component TadA [Candidatus Omnitrophota bacterium]|nr:MAG: Flp pilus assembly complex ATPase component TadA [Candidatus Omnitrophota bacterium]
MALRKSRLKLGELLIKQGLITEEQLQKAIQVQKREGKRIGEVLIKLGLITEKDIVVTLGKQLNIPYASLAKGLLEPDPNQELDKLVPQNFARRYCLIPLSRNLNALTVAFADPLDVLMMDNLKKMTGCDINPIVASESDIIQAIDRFYGEKDLLKEAISESYEAGEVEIEEIPEEEALSLNTLIAKAEEAPVIKLVDLILRQAIKDRASDIHIEPFKDRVSVRYRIDGVLYEIPPPAGHLLLAIVSRIKILAKMDIAEKRLPQDGAFIVKAENRIIDFRVSTIPTVRGEKVVLRILDKSQVPLDLSQLGFEAKDLESYRKAVSSPWGLIFLTGPTGCGKSTTLYATLNEIKTPHKNLVSIEDPVEYRLEGINQVQVKADIGLTFANGLRAFLRQDPNIIMVGEVRDLETAQICLRAALTGHLVLSTLHTNDAPTAISRLIDLGISPYLISPSLLLVGAQRLVRKLCPECKEAYEPTGEMLGKVKLAAELIYRPKGCDYCNRTGYRGRSAIYEILPMSERLSQAIAQGATYQQLKEISLETGMKTLYQNGLKKVEQGITSLEEVLSVTMAGIEG